MSPLAVRKAKDALYRSEHRTLTEMLDLEIVDQTALVPVVEVAQLADHQAL